MLKRLLLLLLSAVCGWAGDVWVRLQSQHFEVFTSADASEGRDVLRRFEQIRHVFETRTGRVNSTPLPVRVFVFRGKNDFRPFQVHPGSVGYYQSGVDRDHIAMQLSGADTYRVVYHEYTHLLLKHAGYRGAAWFNEGVAELFSTSEVGSAEVRVGQPIPGHVLTLSKQPLLDLETLAAVDHDSPYYNERGKSSVFYAQSWALIHMLNFAPEYRGGIANFTEMMLAGESATQAFRQVYGKTPAAVIIDLQAYLRKARFEAIRLQVPQLDSLDFPAENVPDVQVQLHLADLLAAIGRVDEARLAYGRLEALYADHPDVLIALGQMALRTDDYLGARAYFDRAIATGKVSARVYFDFAMALRGLHEPFAAIVDALMKALAADDTFFEAQSYLGVLYLQEERYGDSIPYLRRAAELQPAKATVWENLAVAFHKLGQAGEAQHAAKKARAAARGPEESVRMEALINMMESDVDGIVKVERPKKEGAVGSAATPVRVHGMLSQVDCLGSRARLHIATESGRVFLLVGDASSVRLIGSVDSHIQLACGPVTPRPVIVSYFSEAHTTYGTSGVVSSIEFR